MKLNYPAKIGGRRLQTRLPLGIVWLFSFGTLALYGQSLRVSSIAGSPGETIEVEISLDAPAGKAPAALKWETVFPAQLIEMEGDGPSPGGAAKESGKSLTCTTTKSYSYVCNLAGGDKPVENGLIATFRFKIRGEARIGAATITVEHGEAVSGDAAQMTLTDAEGLITIWSAHSAALNWVASTSSRLAGYNIYRSTTSGGPYTKVNSTPISGTHYTDRSVQVGQTYYYVTTSVDFSGNESEYSNQTTAHIPSP
jgi:hypothetical protein